MNANEIEKLKQPGIRRRNTGEISIEELQETSDSIKGVYSSEIKEIFLYVQYWKKFLVNKT